MRRARVAAALFALVVLGVFGYLTWISGRDQRGPLRLSGTIEAEEVRVAPELGGRVQELLVAKGEEVKAGQVLFRLDPTLLQAQLDQARAARDAAQAQVDLAQARLELARLQYEQVRRQARLAEAPNRLQAWTQQPPADFTLPGWYFTKEERIRAAQKEVDAAAQALEQEKANLQQLLESTGGQQLLEVEARLAEARARYELAKALLDRAKQAKDNQALQDYAQKLFDEALNALESAQTEYDRLLTTQAARDVLEARARVIVAQERYDAALERLYSLQTGDQAPEVRLARAQLREAETALAQAKAALAQAEAQVQYLETQLERLTVTAPVDGVVLSLDARVGEVVQPGVPVLTIGDLARLTLRVYVPETRLNQVRLGQVVDLTVDAYPGRVFPAKVVYISDRAEFTPRNVQTPEERKATVFAVELEIQDPTGRLKPGMPADVVFPEVPAGSSG